jgi:cell fate regulator YaaT (PSP1 superfamily)
MSCNGCSVGTGGAPAGCQSNGNCMTGGCNKLNTHNWLAGLPLPVELAFQVYEVSFKNGLRKGFFANPKGLDLMTGDMVIVDADPGYDVGRISLSGELVKLQMKKRRVHLDTQLPAIQRLANERDLERLTESRAREGATMIRARVVARELKLDMKVGEVEYQGDGRKATFYYIADDRVDFRELIKIYARDFKVKIEMRQIGARQEAGKIGGIGSCGRELCCSTWLTDFKSVSTGVARYQNLSINQAKLSGQCGRLKCCLNYELDTYMDALSAFPKDMDVIQTKTGRARLSKTDIFRRTMVYDMEGSVKPVIITLDNIAKLREQIKNGEVPESLDGFKVIEEVVPVETFAEVTGQVTLKNLEKAGNKNRNKNRDGRDGKGDNRNRNREQNRNRSANERKPEQKTSGTETNKSGDTTKRPEQSNRNPNKNRNRNRNRNKGNRDNPDKKAE